MGDALINGTPAPSRIEYLVFDFDSTLFDTERKKHGFYEIAECHGYTREEAKELYDRSRVIGNRMMISISSFLSVLQEDLKRDSKSFQSREVSAIITGMNRGDGLLPGAKALLAFCKKNHIPRCLLSLGVRDWQEEKVEKSGVDAFFEPDDIIYTDVMNTGKIDILHERLGSRGAGEGVVLFNDKPDETSDILRAFPDMFAYVRQEPQDDRYSDADFAALRKTFPDRTLCTTDLRDIEKQFEQAWNHRLKDTKKHRFDVAFVDFDDTIYRTHTMAQDMQRFLGKAYGVKPEDFNKTFLLAVHGATRDYFNYTFDLHVSLLSDLGYDLNPSVVSNQLRSLLERNYEDPDAAAFLEFLRDVSGRVVLLTAGNESFQRMRIGTTNLGRYFDDFIVIHKDKEYAVRDMVRAGGAYVFVNDDILQNVGMQNEFPDMTVITKRHPVKYSEEELRASNIPYFSTLSDIIEYVERIVR